MSENLGQHFLSDSKVADDIIAAGDVTSEDTALEIGPGKGILTKKLHKKAGKVIAVEKDPDLHKQLTRKLSDVVKSGRLELRKGDIRDFDIDDLISNNNNYKVIANIPYYLTSELIEKFLTTNRKPTQITILTQKEVAERIVAKSKKHSRLSLFVHAYGDPDYIRTVSENAFSPPPKVESAVLCIRNINNDFFQNTDPEEFFKLIRIGFQHKRKTIKNNLKRVYKTETTKKVLQGCKINAKTRPEQITLKQWRCISLNLN